MPSFSDLKDKLQDKLHINSSTDTAPDSPRSLGSSASLIEHPTPEPASPTAEQMASKSTASADSAAAGSPAQADFAKEGHAPPEPSGANSASASLTRDSASIAPSTGAGSIKSAVLEKIDCTPSPRKTQEEFKDAFPDVPADDVLIEEYRCAVSQQMLLQGRLWVSEQRLCFNANIIGYKTDIVLPWSHIRSIEKAYTARVIPNAIELTINDGSSYLFTSFINRDQTYQLLETIWTHHKYIGSQPTREETASTRSEDDNRSQVSYEDEQGNKRRHKFGWSVGGIKLPLPKKVAASHEVDGQPTEAEKVKQAALSKAAGAANVHPPTSYDGDEYKNVVLDLVLATTPEKAYNLFFRDEEFLLPFLENQEELKDINFGGWEDNKQAMDYIKPLHASVGPKQTHCQIENETLTAEPEKLYNNVTITRTEDVPSGKDFHVATRTVMTWAAEGGVHLRVTSEVEWTKVNRFLRGIIEKSAQDGQVQYHKDLVQAVQKQITDNPDEYAVQQVKASVGPTNETKSALEKDDSKAGQSGLGAFLPGGGLTLSLIVLVVFLAVTNLFTLRAMRHQLNAHRAELRAGEPQTVVQGVQHLLSSFEGAQKRALGGTSQRDVRLKGELEVVKRKLVELGNTVDSLAGEF